MPGKIVMFLIYSLIFQTLCAGERKNTAAIRDHFFNIGENDRASIITFQCLLNQDLGTLDIIPKLRLNDDDNDFFLKRILTNPDSHERTIEPTKLSHRKIAQAAELASNHVTQIGQLSDATVRLAALVNYIMDSVKVIWVSVADDANAFTIFETLNDRGLALALSDLLKNYLFGTASDRISEVQQRWVQMIGTLEAIEDDEITVTYIRHLWSSNYGLTREKELYTNIKNEIRNRNSALDFATDLADNARLYAAMLNPTHELWQNYSPTAREHVATLKLLRMTQIRPLLLAVLRQFSISEAQRVLRFMISWSVRFLVTGGIGGGTLENNYSERAREVSERRIRTAAQLSTKMREIVPTDTQFKEAFALASVSTSYIARYYLRVLEKQARGEANPEFVPTDNTEIVNLEHILPQNPSDSWNHFSEEDITSYVKRIGNLALLQTPINTSAGNDSFLYKKTFYQESQYRLTNGLAHYGEWNIDNINERQRELAELAVNTWPLE